MGTNHHFHLSRWCVPVLSKHISYTAGSSIDERSSYTVILSTLNRIIGESFTNTAWRQCNFLRIIVGFSRKPRYVSFQSLGCFILATLTVKAIPRLQLINCVFSCSECFFGCWYPRLWPTGFRRNRRSRLYIVPLNICNFVQLPARL